MRRKNKKISERIIKYYPAFSDYQNTEENNELLGLPLFVETGVSPESLFGEKNRPDILLSSLEDRKIKVKNNKRFHNLQRHIIVLHYSLLLHIDYSVHMIMIII